MRQPLFIVTAVNNENVLSANLLRSPDIATGLAEVFEERGHVSAGLAYNAGREHCGDAPVVAFIHQDVYLPAGWLARVATALAALESEPWAVIGVWGVRGDGQMAGRVWCTGGSQEHVGKGGIQEVASLDEIVLVLNTKYGLKFDSCLPGFHLYATDLILQARDRGLRAFCIDAPVVHNSRRNPQPLDRRFQEAYRYMQRKWSDQLPVKTCVVEITRCGIPLYKQWLKNEIRWRRGKVVPLVRVPDSRELARNLGYEASGTEIEGPLEQISIS